MDLTGRRFEIVDSARSSRGWNCRNAGMALRPCAMTVSISWFVPFTSRSGACVGALPVHAVARCARPLEDPLAKLHRTQCLAFRVEPAEAG